MGGQSAVYTDSGAAVHMASCKVAAAVEPGAAAGVSFCVVARDAAFTAEGCWLEGAAHGTLQVSGTATATLARCTLVRGGGVGPYAMGITNGAAAVLRGCQVRVEPVFCLSSASGCSDTVMLVGGGASLVLEDGTRVDVARPGMVVVAADGAGTSLAVRRGCSIAGGPRDMVILISNGARVVLDGSAVGGGGAGCVRAVGQGASLAVRGCTLALDSPAGSPEQPGVVLPNVLHVAGGAKATVTATRVEGGGRVAVSDEGSVLVHSGLACSGGVVAFGGGTARELPARARGGGDAAGGGCVPPAAAVGPSEAVATGGEQGTAAAGTGGSGLDHAPGLRASGRQTGQ
jgi:hypothetical protein